MKNPAYAGRIEIVEGVTGNGIYLVNPTTGAVTTVLDENGNIDAPITTTNATFSGNTTMGDAAGDTMTLNALTTVTTNQKIQFRDTGIFIQSSADGKLLISADGVGADAITLTGGLTVTNGATFSSPSTFSGLATLNSGAKILDDQTLVLGTDSDVSIYFDSFGSELNILGAPVFINNGIRFLPQLVTATANGLTTGLITLGWSYVSVTSGNANDIITLPAGTAGQTIKIKVGSTGCELRTPATSNATINNVDCDGTNELALAANGLFICECVATNTWVVYGYTNLGAAIATLVPHAA